MEKIYRVQMNSKGMPNFSTAVEIADRPSATEIMNAYHEGVRKGIAEAYEAYGADRKTKPQTCEECEHWNDIEDGCADRHGCRATTEDCSTVPTSSILEQVETMSCAECKHRPIGAEICEEPCHYEPQTDWHYDEQDATWYPYKHEDEPQQKSCATCKHALGNWDGESNNCGRCCGADRRFYEPKTERSSE